MWDERSEQRVVYMVLSIALSLMYVFLISWLMYNMSMDMLFFTVAMLPLMITLAGAWCAAFRIFPLEKKISSMSVERLMQPANVVKPRSTISEAENVMDKSGVNFLCVVDESGSLMGVFTKADAHVARKQRKSGERIEKFMTPADRVVKVEKTEKILDVMERMGKTKHSRLPVVDENKVVGVISSVDINDFISKVLRK